MTLVRDSEETAPSRGLTHHLYLKENIPTVTIAARTHVYIGRYRIVTGNRLNCY